jgi:2-dehydro-3-deoxyphosphogluconate aldolase/(4S)-4-hydroxy-2-oxoglutarate aldolase
VNIEDPSTSQAVGQALIAGGLPIAEITFRTKAAAEAIKVLSAELPDLLVGAGTVLTIEQATAAASAGAKFIVSPGFNPKIVDFCLGKGLPVMPGVNSPSQIEAGLERGLSVLKYFPAEASGGLAALKAMAAPYGRTLKFIPTGGITISNLAEYLRFEQVLACGGTWLTRADLIALNRFDEITRLTKEAVDTVLGFSFGHCTWHVEHPIEGRKAAEALSFLFGFGMVDVTDGLLVADKIKFSWRPGPCNAGDLSILTNSIERAVAYLSKRGIALKSDPARGNYDRMGAISLEAEVAGIAIHLIRRSQTGNTN